jgi:hypothetical protein
MASKLKKNGRSIRGEYTAWCTKKERNATICMKAAVWKSRGIIRGVDKESCFVRLGYEAVEHKKLNGKCNFFCVKLLDMNKKLQNRKIINCVNNIEIRNLGRYLG